MPIRTETFNFLLRFSDGATECYQIAYATGLEAACIDNDWQYRGYISRQVCIYNRAGKCFTEQLADRRTQVADSGAGGIADDYQQWRHWPGEQDPADTDLASDALRAITRDLLPKLAVAIIKEKRRLVHEFEKRYPGAAISEID